MEWLEMIIATLGSTFTFVVAFLAIAMPIMATLHVLMTSDEPRAAIAWFGFVWFVPILGVTLYLLFGIKRIERKAKRARQTRGMIARAGLLHEPAGQELSVIRPKAPNRWRLHSALAGRVSGHSLTSGNHITSLEGGRPAYDAMVDAINGAKTSVALTTYIFQADQAGRRIIKALTRAHERGVEVRVLVDAVGNWYGLKPVSGILRRYGIPVASFNPPSFSWRLTVFNLRTHRKILVVDGQTGFAGGMNIRKSHLANEGEFPQVRDTHFKLEGPIVAQLMEAFSDDWVFSKGEELMGPLWFPELYANPSGAVARAIADGPDEAEEKTRLILTSAIESARQSVVVQTPYFLPSPILKAALRQAALRGVRVDILVPERSNLRFVDMASKVYFPELLKAGCNIHYGQGSFDHSKLIVVDKMWAMFGSSNFDARSLQLNFEFNVELYDEVTAEAIALRIFKKIAVSRPVTIEEIKQRPFLGRMLNKFIWLATPYL